MKYFAHPTAVIDEGATIGEGSSVWHFCHIMPGAVIGEGCTLGQNSFVASTVVLKNNVKVQNNVSLYDGVQCEDDVFIGPGTVFTNVTNPRAAVNRKDEYKTTLIKKGATIGANATILCGVTVATYAFVAAGAVVTKNVPAYALVMGNPARQQGWMSAYGEKLAFDAAGSYTCPHTQEQYRLEKGIVKREVKSI